MAPPSNGVSITAFAVGQEFDPHNPGVSQLVSFLKTGVDLGLSFISLKVQIFAIFIFTKKRWANNHLVEMFIGTALKLQPPKRRVFPQWNLMAEVLSCDPLFAQKIVPHETFL